MGWLLRKNLCDRFCPKAVKKHLLSRHSQTVSILLSSCRKLSCIHILYLTTLHFSSTICNICTRVVTNLPCQVDSIANSLNALAPRTPTAHLGAYSLEIESSCRRAGPRSIQQTAASHFNLIQARIPPFQYPIRSTSQARPSCPFSSLHKLRAPTSERISSSTALGAAPCRSNRK